MQCECGSPMSQAPHDRPGTRWVCDSCPRMVIERWSPKPLLDSLRALLADAKVPRV